jgi:hypothetical protein
VHSRRNYDVKYSPIPMPMASPALLTAYTVATPLQKIFTRMREILQRIEFKQTPVQNIK